MIRSNLGSIDMKHIGLRQHWLKFAGRLATQFAPACVRAAQGFNAVEMTPTHLIGAAVGKSRHQGTLPLVLNIATVARDNATPEAFDKALAELAAQIGIKNARWILLPLRDDYRVSVLPEPAVPSAEISQSVRWQLAPTLDFAIDDAVVAHMTIPTAAWQADKPQELYVIAARAEAMTAYAQQFRNARLRLVAIDIHATAQRNLATLAAETDQGIGMVSFGRENVQITFSWQGELYLDRLIAEPIASFSGQPERRDAILSRVLLQVQRSIDAVRDSLPFISLERILVAGAPPDFCAQLSQSITGQVQPLEIETLFDLSLAPELRDPALAMHYLHVLGAAVRGMDKVA